MGFALMWLESLAAALLLLAWSSGLCSRAAKRWMQIAGALIAAILIMLPACALCVLAGILYVKKDMYGDWVGYMSSWLIVYAIVGGWLVQRSLRTSGEPAVPAGRQWPAAKTGLAAGAVLVVLLMTFWNMDAAAKVRVASLQGEAGALALSVAPVRLPERQNAAQLYERAFEAMPSAEERDKTWGAKAAEYNSGFLKPEFNTKESGFSSYLQRHRATLAFLREATALPGCYFERNYGQPSIAVKLPELVHFRASARVLVMEARAKTESGDVTGALDNILVIQRMAEHVREEPILISFLVSLAVEGIARDALQWVLNGRPIDRAQLDAFKLQDVGTFRHGLRRALIGEEAFGLSSIGLLADAAGAQDLAAALNCGTTAVAAPVAALLRVFLLQDEVASYRKSIGQLRDLTLRPFYEIEAQLKALELNEHRLGIFSALIMPALYRSVVAVTRADASRRLMALAVAMAKYRAQQGRYPEKLADLVPDFLPLVPLDPFDGQPLKLRKTETDLWLYTVGDKKEEFPEKPELESWRVFRLSLGRKD